MMKVGFIGLGSMGAPMCLNVVRAGFDVAAWDIRAEAIEHMVKQGATPATDIRSAVSGADVVLLSLPEPQDVRDVMLRTEGGLIDHLPAGGVVLDLSTVDPPTEESLSRECLRKDIVYIDSPVSGGVPGATAGSLTVMLGCSEAEVQGCLPALRAIGETFYYAGSRGGGATLKIVNNMIALTNMVTISEALNIALASGVSIQTFLDVVGSSSGNSYMVQNKVPRLIAGDKSTGFSIRLAGKDLGLGVELGRTAGVACLVNGLALQVLRLAETQGLGGEDITSIVSMWDRARQQ